MFPVQVIEDAKRHAVEQFPREAVGFVVDDVYLPQTNIAESPEEHFRVADDAYLAYSRTLQAIIHSHPGGPDHPSLRDMRQQMATGVTWGVVVVQDHPDGPVAGEPFFWGDDVLIADLVGREFRHGIHDCYSLVRDYFRTQRGIIIPDYPRDEIWWNKGENLYVENFKAAGFATVAEPEPGDCFIAQIHSHVPNHAGVYIGDGLILHHLSGRLSRHEPAYPWQKFITHWVRLEVQPPTDVGVEV